MNFRELKNFEKKISSNEIATNTFKQEFLIDYLKKESKKFDTNSNAFVYFYEDIIDSKFDFDFQSELGVKYYKNATDDALSCLYICDDFKKLSSWKINGWLHSALKFVDNIVLHYIQENLKEIPKTIDGCGLEKSRYIQLAEKNGDISIVGSELKDLYDLRNDLEHRTITHPDGKQEILSPKRNSVRKIVVKLYPDVLKRILKTYKELSHNA